MNKDTDTIQGLRFQTYDSGEVHVHDDNRGLVFKANGKDFKTEVEAALKELKDRDGAFAITGDTDEILYLVRDKKNLSTFVAKGDVSSDLKKFIKKL
jgi:hypothetical protein